MFEWTSVSTGGDLVRLVECRVGDYRLLADGNGHWFIEGTTPLVSGAALELQSAKAAALAALRERCAMYLPLLWEVDDDQPSSDGWWIVAETNTFGESRLRVAYSEDTDGWPEWHDGDGLEVGPVTHRLKASALLATLPAAAREKGADDDE